MRDAALQQNTAPLRLVFSTCVVVGLAHAKQQAVPGDAGVIDKDIHTAEFLFDRVKQVRTALGGGDVGLDSQDLCPGFPAERRQSPRQPQRCPRS